MPPIATGHPNRREALRLFSAGAAVLMAGCKPASRILPYRDMPEGRVPGQPDFFATTLSLAGAGRGVLVESHEGRPTKIHGNPQHPASQGATDIFAEAAVLDLFDPSRSTAPTRADQPAGWNALAVALRDAVSLDGAVLLTGPVGSPTMARQIADLLSARPGLRWASYSTVRPALRLGNAQLWPDFDHLDAVVSIGADPLGSGPAQIGFAKSWSAARRDRRARFRSHVFEAAPTLTGTQADRRTPLPPSGMDGVVQGLLAAMNGSQAPSGPIAEAAAILRSAPGRAVVLAEGEMSAEAAARIVEINRAISAPLRYLRPFDHWPGLTAEPVSAIAADMTQGRVPALIVLDANPVYDLGESFAEAMFRVPRRLHFGTRSDETAAASDWHGPLHHGLEDWSDLRSVDGSAGMIQPLIAPLHDSRSGHQVLAMMQDAAPSDPHEIVQQTWRAVWDKAGFQALWHRSLHDGVIPGTGPEDIGAGAAAIGSPTITTAAATGPGYEVTLRPSASILDGGWAANAWLQECPDPFTKQVWGNAVWLSPSDASEAGIADEDLVELRGQDRAEILPALIVEGQAPGSVTLHLGYGRGRASPIGTAVGTRVAGLGHRVTVRRIGTSAVARLQSEFSQHGREILRNAGSVADDPRGSAPASFYPQPGHDGLAWGMVIDTDACIGCNACMIACQSENNIPVVGPDEVRRDRHMHWMRVDRYLMPEGGHAFQPVPCMHCEIAPCEPVCPVAASVHDSEGLNVQVYNRCIGTRFCQANCPYKVRRFNFFDYADGEAYQNQGADLLKALRNPDVSVRARGVMEKCTYCVQRISAARRQAEKQDRPLADGDVVTACQSACPTEAIRFGDLNDPQSDVSQARRDPRHYALLEELGTRPRTTYLARTAGKGGT